MARAEIPAPDIGPDEAPAAPSHRRPPRAAAPLLAAAGCAAVLAVAGVRLAGEVTRGPTAAERSAAVATEIGRRYLTWPAGRIFPAGLRYTLDEGSAETARRVGIGTDTRCGTAVDARLSGALTARGCLAVLRATYLDQAQGLAVTVGVAAFPDGASARGAVARFPASAPSPGLRALPFPGTVAARFADAARQAAAAAQRGPYVVAATVGYADGRPALRAARRLPDVAELAPQLVDGVLHPLTAPARIRCGTREWSC
ncbi:hypothetical protein F8568_033915 [Actinomadura sp. LD22]|uniref:Uncharacterized protein n=1 Tax=Actinomadura physcomitrii TaxID=2650748 RepID=A0A6I4ML00_9ACTN|nr:hypothetical protein [Actinomadura physcomitrii]MWA05275.1 hypothetical protein [Actinomadura physcomitrii]